MHLLITRVWRWRYCWKGLEIGAKQFWCNPLQSLYFAHSSTYHSSGSAALGTRRQPQRGQAKKVGRWQPSSRCWERHRRRRRRPPGFATAVVAVGSSPVSSSGGGAATATCLSANRVSWFTRSPQWFSEYESLLGSVHTLSRTFTQRNFQMLLPGHHVVPTQQLFYFSSNYSSFKDLIIQKQTQAVINHRPNHIQISLDDPKHQLLLLLRALADRKTKLVNEHELCRWASWRRFVCYLKARNTRHCARSCFSCCSVNAAASEGREDGSMLACPLFLCNGDDSVCFFLAIIPMSLSWKVLLVHDLSNLACNYPIET